MRDAMPMLAACACSALPRLDAQALQRHGIHVLRQRRFFQSAVSAYLLKLLLNIPSYRASVSTRSSVPSPSGSRASNTPKGRIRNICRLSRSKSFDARTGNALALFVQKFSERFVGRHGFVERSERFFAAAPAFASGGRIRSSEITVSGAPSRSGARPALSCLSNRRYSQREVSMR